MAAHAVLRNMMAVGVCQLCGLQRRTFVFFRSPGYNFVTQTFKEFSVIRSKSSAFHQNKNIFERDLYSRNTKRYSSDQSLAPAKPRLPLIARLLLVTSGAASIGYYAVHTRARSDGPAKQWKISLYRRMPLKTMSRMWGRFNQMELPVFLRKPLLGLYIWMFGCNLQEAEIEDLKLYRNLGEFFRRQLKPHVRPIDVDHELTSPADGRILYHGQVKHGILEQVKGVTYSLRGFLGPHMPDSPSHDASQLTDEDYQNCLSLQPGNQLYHCIIYLAPGDYHRFHSPATWTVEHRRHFPGELLSVSPGVARWVQGLFNFNERAVYTGRWEHGFFSMTAVGATNVGSIKIYCDEDLETNTKRKYPEHTYFDKKFTEPITLHKGDMFGEFNLGSTIVLIFEAPSGFKFKAHEGDKVKYGRPLGTPS